MTDADWQARVRTDHEASIERGEHDAECEFDVDDGFYICHCSKRRREAAGFTEVPTEDLYFPPPACPRCDKQLDHDGDQWRCYGCCLAWNSNGHGDTAVFTDEFGDLSRCEEHDRRGCWHCQNAESTA